MLQASVHVLNIQLPLPATDYQSLQLLCTGDACGFSALDRGNESGVTKVVLSEQCYETSVIKAVLSKQCYDRGAVKGGY